MKKFKYSVSVKTSYENNFEYVQLCISLKQVFKFIKYNSKIDNYSYIITPIEYQPITFTPDF